MKIKPQDVTAPAVPWTDADADWLAAAAPMTARDRFVAMVLDTTIDRLYV